MTNDQRVNKLNKKLSVSLVYSDKIEHKNASELDKEKLKNLAAKIRKNLEENSFEAPAQSYPHIRS